MPDETHDKAVELDAAEREGLRQRLHEWTAHAIKFNTAVSGGATVAFIALAANVNLVTLPRLTSIAGIISATCFMVALAATGFAIAGQFTTSWRDCGDNGLRSPHMKSLFAEKPEWFERFGSRSADFIVIGYFAMISGMAAAILTLGSWVSAN